MLIVVVTVLTALQLACPTWGRNLRRGPSDRHEDIESVLQRNRQITDLLIPLLQASLSAKHPLANRPKDLPFNSKRPSKNKGPVVELLPLTKHRNRKTPLAIILASDLHKNHKNYLYRHKDDSSEELGRSHKSSYINSSNSSEVHDTDANSKTEEGVTHNNSKNRETETKTDEQEETKRNVAQKQNRNKPKLRLLPNSHSDSSQETHESDVSSEPSGEKETMTEQSKRNRKTKIVADRFSTQRSIETTEETDEYASTQREANEHITRKLKKENPVSSSSQESLTLDKHTTSHDEKTLFVNNDTQEKKRVLNDVTKKDQSKTLKQTAAEIGLTMVTAENNDVSSSSAKDVNTRTPDGDIVSETSANIDISEPEGKLKHDELSHHQQKHHSHQSQEDKTSDTSEEDLPLDTSDNIDHTDILNNDVTLKTAKNIVTSSESFEVRSHHKHNKTSHKQPSHRSREKDSSQTSESHEKHGTSESPGEDVTSETSGEAITSKTNVEPNVSNQNTAEISLGHSQQRKSLHPNQEHQGDNNTKEYSESELSEKDGLKTSQRDIESETSDVTLKFSGNDVDPDVSDHSISSETVENIISSTSNERRAYHEKALQRPRKHKLRESKKKHIVLETSESSETAETSEKDRAIRITSEVSLEQKEPQKRGHSKQKGVSHHYYKYSAHEGRKEHATSETDEGTGEDNSHELQNVEDDTYSKEVARKYAYDSAYTIEYDTFGGNRNDEENPEILNEDQVQNRGKDRGKEIANQPTKNIQQTHKTYKLSFKFNK